MLKWSLFCLYSLFLLLIVLFHHLFGINLFHSVPKFCVSNKTWISDIFIVNMLTEWTQNLQCRWMNWPRILPFSQLILEQIQLLGNLLSFLLPKVKMGLLVDLTNTSRFYDRNDIEKEGIKYIKLQCKG